MWYKLKRILIYPDGVTEKQVYPKKLYEYSYNFVWKTISQIVSDWWATAQWTPTITSSWYTSTSISRVRSNFTLPSLSTAKKIILATTLVVNTNWYTKAVRLFGDGRTYATWYLVWYTDSSIQIWWDSYSVSAVSAWTYETKAVIDLENWTATFSLTWRSNSIYTLTATQINNIKSCTVAEVFSDDNRWAVSSVSLEIE